MNNGLLVGHSYTLKEVREILNKRNVRDTRRFGVDCLAATWDHRGNFVEDRESVNELLPDDFCGSIHFEKQYRDGVAFSKKFEYNRKLGKYVYMDITTFY